MRAYPILLLTLLCISSCNDDSDSLTEAERVTKILTNGKWSLASVSVDDMEANDLFEDFSITFTDTGYATTGTTPVWARNGTWGFINPNSPDQFTREDSTKVTIVSIEETMLSLELTWTRQTISGGRLLSIKGRHVFVLIR